MWWRTLFLAALSCTCAANDEPPDETDSDTLAIEDVEPPEPEESVPDAGTDVEAGPSAPVFQWEARACIHTIDGKRPRLTRADQRYTKRAIRHFVRRHRADTDLAKLFLLIAMRESSLRQGLIHRLSADVEASYISWRRLHKRYAEAGNPYADDPKLWLTYGLAGMNSNYFLKHWSRRADPRVLCDGLVDLVAYRRALLAVLRKVQGGLRCRGEEYNPDPTWHVLHRAVSGGKLCPSKHEDRAATMKSYFNKRAARVGLDSERHVTQKMLGKEPREGLDGTEWRYQEQMVMGLWEEIDAVDESE